jgi:hypothetical protein
MIKVAHANGKEFFERNFLLIFKYLEEKDGLAVFFEGMYPMSIELLTCIQCRKTFMSFHSVNGFLLSDPFKDFLENMREQRIYPLAASQIKTYLVHSNKISTHIILEMSRLPKVGFYSTKLC